MLVREPDDRIALEDIARHPWLLRHEDDDENSVGGSCGDFSNELQDAKYMLTAPLIKRQNLTETETTDIVEQMILGNVASREQIKK